MGDTFKKAVVAVEVRATLRTDLLTLRNERARSLQELKRAGLDHVRAKRPASDNAAIALGLDMSLALVILADRHAAQQLGVSSKSVLVVTSTAFRAYWVAQIRWRMSFSDYSVCLNWCRKANGDTTRFSLVMVFSLFSSPESLI